jgi:hypothetical protein
MQLLYRYSKLHYFCEIDVFRTLQNFVREVPEFWASDELWETLETGEVLSIGGGPGAS